MNTPDGQRAHLTRKTALASAGIGTLGLLVSPVLSRASDAATSDATREPALIAVTQNQDYLVARVDERGALHIVNDVTLPGYANNAARVAGRAPGELEVLWPNDAQPVEKSGLLELAGSSVAPGSTVILIGTLDGGTFKTNRVSIEPPRMPVPTPPKDPALLLP